MHIPEVLETTFGIDNGKVDVKVSIFLLSLFDHVDEFLYRSFKLVFMSTIMTLRSQKIADRFDPTISARFYG